MLFNSNGKAFRRDHLEAILAVSPGIFETRWAYRGGKFELEINFPGDDGGSAKGLPVERLEERCVKFQAALVMRAQSENEDVFAALQTEMRKAIPPCPVAVKSESVQHFFNKYDFRGQDMPTNFAEKEKEIDQALAKASNELSKAGLGLSDGLIVELSRHQKKRQLFKHRNNLKLQERASENNI
jgi:hypothetical protein